MSQSKYIIASPDELYHFKYIKRIQGPDGKYRYYYGDQATHKRIQSQLRDASNLYQESDKLNKKASKANAIVRKNSTGWNAKMYSTKTPTIVRENADAFIKNSAAAREARNTADRIVSLNDYYTVGKTAKRNLSAARDKVSRKVNIARGRMKRDAIIAKNNVNKRLAPLRDQINATRGRMSSSVQRTKNSLKKRFASIRNKFKRKR